MTAERRPGVVVTGAAGDMGAAVVRSFLADGHAVFGGDIAPMAPAAGFTALPCDVRDRAAVFALARAAAAASELRVWVNCAGIVATAPIDSADAETWQRILDVNLTGTFNGCAAAFAAMRGNAPPGGRIVNAGSISGQLGGVGPHPAYGASKAGVHALTKSYALAGARHGIYCNAIAPSIIEGNMAAAFGGAQLEKYTLSVPLRRLATMAEIVHAIRYLADPKASFTTGVILGLNGGALNLG